jgi:hypothetical protein
MPTLTFNCPGCARLLQVPADLAGKIVRCPACLRTVVAPPAAAEQAPPAPPPPPPEEVLSLPLADDEPDADWFPAQPLPTAEDEELEVEEVKSESPAERGTPRRRKKRKKRRRAKSGELLDGLRYFTGGLGIFLPVLLGLAGMSLLCGVVTCLVPSLSVGMIVMGGGMYAVGWLWFLLVAFRDDSFHGVLCLVTQLYCFVYLFVNLEETWKPAALMVLGSLVAGAGVGILVLASPEAAEVALAL